MSPIATVAIVHILGHWTCESRGRLYGLAAANGQQTPPAAALGASNRLHHGTVRLFLPFAQPLLRAHSTVAFIKPSAINLNGRLRVRMPENLAEPEIALGVLLQPLICKDVPAQMRIHPMAGIPLADVADQSGNVVLN